MAVRAAPVITTSCIRNSFSETVDDLVPEGFREVKAPVKVLATLG